MLIPTVRFTYQAHTYYFMKFYFVDHKIVEIWITQIIFVSSNLLKLIRMVLYCRTSCSQKFWFNPLKKRLNYNNIVIYKILLIFRILCIFIYSQKNCHGYKYLRHCLCGPSLLHTELVFLVTLLLSISYLLTWSIYFILTLNR